MLAHPRGRVLFLVVISMALLVAPWVSAADAPVAQDERILVRFSVDASASERALARANANASFLREYTLVPGLELLAVQSSPGVERALAALQANPHVLYAEPDYVLQEAETWPNDPRYSDLWGMENINAPAAWDVSTGAGEFVVAVIDTGIDYTHADLAANIWTNPGEIAGNGIDDDHNGYVDDVHGYDFVNDDGDPMDDRGHGTHCAGTIGGVGNNGVGVAGVNWDIKLMPLKFLDASGSGFTSDAVLALQYAVDMGVSVSSNSWSGSGYSTSLYDAINAARSHGHIVVAAASNNGTNNDIVPYYPASYSLDNIIAVAAIDSSEALASFSNWGVTTVDLGAPGVSILSTVPGGYSYYSGTSMATPHVAGAVALLYGLHPDWTYAQVRDQILDNVRPTASVAGKTVTGGVLDIGAAIGAPSAPAAPSDLVATALSEIQIGLTWTDNATDETAQVIERAPSGGGWAELATVSAGVTSYTDTGLSAGDTMQYRVKAVRDGVSSDYTNVAQATTPIPGLHVATADYTAATGTVSGTYMATTTQDDAYQVITEIHQGGKPSSRYDALDHVWLVPLSGANYVLHVDAFVQDAGDADAGMAFSYATAPGGPWTEAFTITAAQDTDNYASAPIAGSVGGALYVRVTDTDHTPGQNSNDVLYVDHLYVDGGTAPTDPPGAASNPGPADGAVDQATTVTLTWTPGDGATSHVIYLGTDPEALPEVSTQSSVGYEATGLDPVTTYYWRVDEVNSVGTATGSEWSFTTGSVAEPTSLHVASIVLDAPRTAPPASAGQATVTIVDDLGNPVAGATVIGTFSLFDETLSATTNVDGVAVLTTTSTAKKPAFGFCVDDATGTLPYAPGDDAVTCPTYP